VRDAIARYERAVNGLDAAGVQAVFPSMDVGALRRGYAALDSQQLALSSCDVRVDGDGATADCQRVLEAKPKVGKAQRLADQVRLTLHRAGGGWVIDRLAVR